MSAELMFFKPVDQREETTHRLTPKVRSDGFSLVLLVLTRTPGSIYCN